MAPGAAEKKGRSAYVELRCKSAFSFLEAASQPEDLVARAADLGFDTLALGDRDGVYGVPRFHQQANSKGMRAIVGADLLVVDSVSDWQNSLGASEGIPGGFTAARVLVLVRDQDGYRSLCRLLTMAKGRIPKEIAVAHGAPITWAELNEDASGFVSLGSPLMSQSAKVRLAEISGPDGCALELWRHRNKGDERQIRETLRIGRALGVPVVATNDVRYATPNRAELCDVLLCIRNKTTLEEAGDLLATNRQRHLKSPAAMGTLFQDLPDAIKTSRTIAEKAAFTLQDLGYRFPDYPLPPGQTPLQELRRWVLEGLGSRYPEGPSEDVQAQIRREIDLIEKLDLSGYFLIVHDIVRFCRQEGILVQGRGSAANSTVCYVLGITAVDPVARGLLFERFLSEDREEWPDIDLDLPSGDLREKAIQYVYRRYGPHGAAMTANAITFRGRSAVRDVGKVLGFPPETLEKAAKCFWHHDFGNRAATLQRLDEAGLDAADPKAGKLLELVSQIQNLPRHLGQHSGGMVICKGRLDEVVPIEPASMPGRTVIAWDKEDCADLGILKIDLLGLGMMQVLQDAVPMIRENEGIEVDYGRLPQDDPRIWDMLCAADTVGVFQVESRAQMNILPRLRPRCFYDLVVSIGLIRPGPIVGQMVSPYLERRAARQPVKLPHPDLEPVLARTMGVPIFQEQVMRMAMVMAGFTGAQAESLRRAMGFKRSEERMVDIERDLRKGMAAKGVTNKQADEVVGYITSFAQYGFPEAHSFSFALIAYSTAYLKAHHPAAFLACLLNAWPMGFYHPSTLIRDAQRHGVKVLPIDAMRSDWNCKMEQGAVRLGLRYVQGLRQEAGMQICRDRRGHPFRGISDLMQRTKLKTDEIEQLAMVGALGSLNGKSSRREALWQVQGLQAYRTGLLAGAEPGDDAYGLVDMDALEELRMDMIGTGLSISAHPMEFAREQLEKRGVVSAADLDKVPSGRQVNVAGVVIVRNRPPTAKGMLFMSLEDETGLMNVVVDPPTFDRYRTLILTSPSLLLRGKLKRRDGVANIKVEHIEGIDGNVFRVASRDFR